MVEKFCSRALWIENGKAVISGETSTVVNEYRKSFQG
jgi:ABC-type polysaccharide/polyol phosphate transport system ATPase subunit